MYTRKITLIIILLSSIIYTQYLEVRRPATIRAEPNLNAEILFRCQTGEFLNLLDDGQQENDYYHVSNSEDTKMGWIYRKLVRRYEGNIPIEEPETRFSYDFSPPPVDYYSTTTGLEGDQLKSELNKIIRDHNEYSYDDVWEILKVTDVDFSNPSNVIGLYSGFSMDADLQWDWRRGWSREHVWAKTRGDFGISKGAGTDVHHIRAEDVSTNSARNNRSFDECNIPYIDKKGNYNGETGSFTSSYSEFVWEPRDEVKGDVARMIFYMVVRYEGENDEPDLELTEDTPNRNSKLPFHGKKSVLIQWHEEDPVDDIERYRNHVIYEYYQKNRNPFIDNPEFVSRIWND